MVEGKYVVMKVSKTRAQILQWAVVEKNALGINSIDIKNFFIRGSVRLPGYEYPSTQTGYGRLEIYESFRQI